MNIQREHIVLRAIEPKDKEMLLEIINDAGTEYLLGGWALPVSSIQQEEWIKNYRNDEKNIRLIIEEKECGKPLGMVMLTNIDYKNGHAEIHIKLSKDMQGKGFGMQAIKTMTGYAFDELRLHKIFSIVLSYNIASKKMFEKCGFSKDGTLREHTFKKGKYVDAVLFSIITDTSPPKNRLRH